MRTGLKSEALDSGLKAQVILLKSGWSRRLNGCRRGVAKVNSITGVLRRGRRGCEDIRMRDRRSLFTSLLGSFEVFPSA